MALEHEIHTLIQGEYGARIEPDQLRRELLHACLSTRSEGRVIERPERGHFPPADDPTFSFELHDGGQEALGRSAA